MASLLIGNICPYFPKCSATPMVTQSITLSFPRLQLTAIVPVNRKLNRTLRIVVTLSALISPQQPLRYNRQENGVKKKMYLGGTCLTASLKCIHSRFISQSPSCRFSFDQHTAPGGREEADNVAKRGHSQANKSIEFGDNQLFL